MQCAANTCVPKGGVACCSCAALCLGRTLCFAGRNKYSIIRSSNTRYGKIANAFINARWVATFFRAGTKN